MSLTLKAETYLGEDGKIHLRYESLERLTKYKSALAAGTKLAVTFRRWETHRSERQSRLLHTLCHRIAKENKESVEAVKTRAKMNAGYYVNVSDITSGKIAKPSWRASGVVDLAEIWGGVQGERFALVKSETDFSTQEEGDVIDRLLLECSDLGVYIEDIVETIAQHRTNTRRRS